MNNTEKTLSIIKPDAVERNLENEIKQMFLEKGFKIFDEKKEPEPLILTNEIKEDKKIKTSKLTKPCLQQLEKW